MVDLKRPPRQHRSDCLRARSHFYFALTLITLSAFSAAGRFAGAHAHSLWFDESVNEPRRTNSQASGDEDNEGSDGSSQGDDKQTELSIQIMSYMPEGPDHYIIKNGIVQAPYTSDSKEPSASAPSGDHTSWLTFSSPEKGPLMSAVRGLTLRALPLGADGTVDPNDANIKRASGLKVSVKKSSSGAHADGSGIYSHVVDIAYLCNGVPGKFTIVGTVPYRTSGKHQLHVFTLRKTCGEGLIHGFNVFTDAAAPGGQLTKKASGEATTFANAQASADIGAAILNGDPTPPFGPLSSMPYRVGYAQDSLVLSIRGIPKSERSANSASLEPFHLAFNISQVTIGHTPSRSKGSVTALAVALEGEAAGGGTLEAGDDVELRLVFDCIVSGTPLVTLEFVINEHAHLRSRMSFLKECHVGPLPGFDVIPGGIDVAGHLVVKDGLATPSFAEGSPTALVDALHPSAEFELVAARPGLVLPLSTIYVTAQDFTVDDVKRGKGFPHNNHPNWKSKGDSVGEGSIFGPGGSILDHFANKIFKSDDADASPFGGPTLLQHFFDDPFQIGGRRRRRLWRPNKRKHGLNDDFVIDDDAPRVQVLELPGRKNQRGRFRQSKRHRSTVLRASVSGTAITMDAVSSNETATLVVTHDCLRSGSSIVTVHIEVVPSKAREDEETAREYGMSDSLSHFLEKIFHDAKAPKTVAFSYVKKCIVGSVPGLDVTLGAYTPIRKNSGYTIFRGRVVGPFQVASRQKVVIREAEKRSHFYLSLDNDGWLLDVQNIKVVVTHATSQVQNSGKDGDTISHDVQRIASPKVAILSDRTGSRLSANDAHEAFRVVGSRQHPGTKIIEVEYNCRTSGVARLAMQLEIQPTLPNGKVEPVRALTVSWEKICHVPIIQGLNIETLQPQHSVVSDGIIQRPFEISNHEVRFGKRVDRLTFLISLSSSENNINSGKAQGKAKRDLLLPIGRPRVTSNNDLCSPKLTGEAMKSFQDAETMRMAAVATSSEVARESPNKIVIAPADQDVILLGAGRSSKLELSVDFNCKRSKNGTSIVTVTLPIRPPSTNNGKSTIKGGGKKPIFATYTPSDVSFSFAKRCAEHRRARGASWLSTTVGKLVITICVVLGIFVVAGVLFFPEKIINLRARLLRYNYKYQRVKLEDEPGSANQDAVELAVSTKANGAAAMSSPTSLLQRVSNRA